MPFDALAERLLKGGIAPRHVRRYVRELADHLDDLTAQQRAGGYDGDDARRRARARLGEDSELARAMLDQPGMRSWPARMPWLIFLLLPPVLTAVIGLTLYTAAHSIGYGAARISAVLPLSESGLAGFSAAAMAAVQMLAAPVMAALLVLAAQRQRLKPVWPLLGIALLATQRARDRLDRSMTAIANTMSEFDPLKGLLATIPAISSKRSSSENTSRSFNFEGVGDALDATGKTVDGQHLMTGGLLAIAAKDAPDLKQAFGLLEKPARIAGRILPPVEEAARMTGNIRDGVPAYTPFQRPPSGRGAGLPRQKPARWRA